MPATPWLWISLALLLFAASAYSLARYIIGDRPRARRRCPKCWYDLAGIPDACPECGRRIRSQRELSRTRRHKRWAALGVALALLGAGSLVTRQAIAHGTISLIPDRALIASVERWPEGALIDELFQRYSEGRLSRSNQRRLITASARALREDHRAARIIAATLVLELAEQTGRELATRQAKPWMEIVRPREVVEPCALVLSILPLLSHEDPRVRQCAVKLLEDCSPKSAIIFPAVCLLAAHDEPKREAAAQAMDAILGRIADPYGRIAWELNPGDGPATVPPDLDAYLESLSALHNDLPAFRTHLRAGITHQSQLVRLISMWIVRSCFWPDDELRLLALRLYDPSEPPIAQAILDFAVSGELDDPATSVIRQALRSSDHMQWLPAVSRLGERGPDAAAFAPNVMDMLGDYRALNAAVPYWRITGDAETAARALLRRARESTAVLDLILDNLATIGWIDDDVLQLAYGELEADDPIRREIAAVAILHLRPPHVDRAELTRIAAEAGLRKSTIHGKRLLEAITRGEADIPTLLRSLESWPAKTEEVITALGFSGSEARDALPFLEASMGDPDPWIATSAAWAIRRINWCLEHGDPLLPDR